MGDRLRAKADWLRNLERSMYRSMDGGDTAAAAVCVKSWW